MMATSTARVVIIPLECNKLSSLTRRRVGLGRGSNDRLESRWTDGFGMLLFSTWVISTGIVLLKWKSPSEKVAVESAARSHVF
jgi:hypothetical protein